MLLLLLPSLHLIRFPFVNFYTFFFSPSHSSFIIILNFLSTHNMFPIFIFYPPSDWSLSKCLCSCAHVIQQREEKKKKYFIKMCWHSFYDSRLSFQWDKNRFFSVFFVKCCVFSFLLLLSELLTSNNDNFHQHKKKKLREILMKFIGEETIKVLIIENNSEKKVKTCIISN